MDEQERRLPATSHALQDYRSYRSHQWDFERPWTGLYQETAPDLREGRLEEARSDARRVADELRSYGVEDADQEAFRNFPYDDETWRLR
jgi:hypothetical protein